MQKLLNKRISVSYENDIKGNYLVLNLHEEEKIIDYQAKMIQNNPAIFFIPFNIRRKNDKTFLAYDVTSKISVAQYLNQKKVGRQEVVQILRNLLRAINESVNYLLDERSFIIHEDYIFINAENLTVSLIYIPINLKSDFDESLKRFVLNFINGSVEPGKSLDISIEKISTYIKTNDFKLEDFNCILDGIQKHKGFKNKDLISVGGTEDFKISIPKTELTEKDEYVAASIYNSEIDKKRNLSINQRNDERSRTLLILAVLQVLVVLLVFLIYKIGGSYDFSTLFGVIMIAFSADVFAIRFLINKRQINFRSLLKSGKSEGIK